MRRNVVKRQLSHLYKSVHLGLCLPLANNLVSFTTPDLSWDPPLGCTCTPQPKFLEGARLIMVWHYPLTFNPQGASPSMCSVSLVLKGREIP